MKKYKIDDESLIYIDNTSSQVETALYISDHLSSEQKNKPIAFANIDTILFSRNNFFKLLKEIPKESGLIDTFEGQSKEYSYARFAENGKIIDIVDKKIISNNACSGLYGFSSYDQMSKIAFELIKMNGQANFTDLYQKYIEIGKEIYSHHVANRNQTIVLGTPEEYLINIHRFK